MKTLFTAGIGRYEKHGELLKNPIECDSVRDGIAPVMKDTGRAGNYYGFDTEAVLSEKIKDVA